MSHDRGCFRCGDDPPYTDCKRSDCPKHGLSEDISLGNISKRVLQAQKDAETLLMKKGLDCRLKHGLYKGRLAKVDGVIVDHARGLLVLAMVYHQKDEGLPRKLRNVLNSDTQSRQYWPLDDLEILW